MVVAHNLTAMNAQRQFNIVGNNKKKSMEKLSSGYRINRAADDAAGLAISEKMRKQIRGLSRGVTNCQDGVSLCQVADGAMSEATDMIHRMSELCIQSANGTNSDEDREYIDQEIQQLKLEIDRLGNNTVFNEDIYVLQGSVREYSHTESVYETQKVLDHYETLKSKEQIVIGSEVDMNDIKFTYDDDIFSYLGEDGQWNKNRPVTYYVNDSFTGKPVPVNGNGYTLDFSKIKTYDDWKKLNGLVMEIKCCACTATTRYVFDNSKSGITLMSGGSLGADSKNVYVVGTKDYTNYEDFYTQWVGAYNPKILGSTKIADYTNAHRVNETTVFLNEGPIVTSGKITNDMVRFGHATIRELYDYKEVEESVPVYRDEEVAVGTREVFVDRPVDLKIQYGSDVDQNLILHLPHVDCEALDMTAVSGKTDEEALKSIDILGDALIKINRERSRMGAYTNELEHLIDSENNIVENTSAAESKIRDTDMAKEMVELSKQSILEQVGQYMMAQANQSNQGVLSLLQ